MNSEERIDRVLKDLNEIVGFNPDVYLDFINDMAQARSTAYYTEEKKENYRRLNFSEAIAFVTPGSSNGRAIKTAMILSNLRSIKKQNISIGGSYF